MQTQMSLCRWSLPKPSLPSTSLLGCLHQYKQRAVLAFSPALSSPYRTCVLLKRAPGSYSSLCARGPAGSLVSGGRSLNIYERGCIHTLPCPDPDFRLMPTFSSLLPRAFWPTHHCLHGSVRHVKCPSTLKPSRERRVFDKP